MSMLPKKSRQRCIPWPQGQGASFGLHPDKLGLFCWFVWGKRDKIERAAADQSPTPVQTQRGLPALCPSSFAHHTLLIHGTFTFGGIISLCFREMKIGNWLLWVRRCRGEISCERAEYHSLLPYITSLVCLHILLYASFPSFLKADTSKVVTLTSSNSRSSSWEMFFYYSWNRKSSSSRLRAMAKYLDNFFLLTLQKTTASFLLVLGQYYHKIKM